jgi:hypothetical protein
MIVGKEIKRIELLDTIEGKIARPRVESVDQRRKRCHSDDGTGS